MYLDAAKKQEIFEKYGKSNTDTGSAEAQIALFSYRISHLTEHLKLNRKDYSTDYVSNSIFIEKDLKKSRSLKRKRLFYFLLLRFYCSVVENYSLVG